MSYMQTLNDSVTYTLERQLYWLPLNGEFSRTVTLMKELIDQM